MLDAAQWWMRQRSPRHWPPAIWPDMRLMSLQWKTGRCRITPAAFRPGYWQIRRTRFLRHTWARRSRRCVCKLNCPPPETSCRCLTVSSLPTLLIPQQRTSAKGAKLLSPPGNGGRGLFQSRALKGRHSVEVKHLRNRVTWNEGQHGPSVIGLSANPHKCSPRMAVRNYPVMTIMTSVTIMGGFFGYTYLDRC